MNDIFEAELTLLNGKLTAAVKSQMLPGLLSGKMGCCVYFYKMAKATGNVQYEKTADFLLNSVCSSLKNFRLWDIETGLTGIALGVDFLIKENLVCGNINKTLREFDVLLFKLLSFPDKNQPAGMWLKIQLLYYFSIRISGQKKGSDEDCIFRELICGILNSFIQFPAELWDEPYSFSLQYRLPFFLYALGQASGHEYFRPQDRENS